MQSQSGANANGPALFDQVLAYCGLSTLIGPGILHRTLADEGVNRTTATVEDYVRVLPRLGSRLRAYFAEEEAVRRIRHLTKFLAVVAAGGDPAERRTFVSTVPPAPGEMRLPVVRLPTFNASSMIEDGVMRLVLTGNADTSAEAALSRYLTAVHAEALRAEVTAVEVVLGELFFMSSSCLEHMVGWLTEIEELEPSRRYAVHLHGSAILPWQRRSFEALRAFGGEDVVTVSIR
jgi:hypothetical protein